MTAPTIRLDHKVSYYAGLSVLGIGSLTLLGWILNNDLLKEFGRGLPAMKVNAALAFVFGGASLMFSQGNRRRRTVPILLACLTAFLGALTFIEYRFGIDLKIDELFAFDRASGALPAGRMAIATANIFVMDGLSIVFYEKRFFRISHAMAIGASFVALLCFAEVCYGSLLDGEFVTFGSLAWSTTLAACLFNLGILALEQDHGLVAALRRPGLNGAMARRLLPAAVVIPFLLGWLRQYGQRQGLYGTDFGLAVLTTSTTTILVVLIWFNTDSLFHVEVREAEAKSQLQSQYRLVAQQSDDLRRQAELIDQSNDAIITMDSERRIRSWNRGAQELYQWTAAEAVGKVLHQFLRAKSSTTVADVDRILLETGRWGGELAHSRRNGKTVTVDSREVVLLNKKGDVTGIMEINRDITASRAMEEHVRQTQKLESVGQLAAGIAHDFNNLLTVISGYADMLLMEPSLDKPLQDSVEEIVTAAGRAAAITRQLLAFSRRQVTVRQNVALNDIVAGIEKMLRRLVVENIELVMALDDERPVVNVDPGQMEQVIMNLVVNARDAISGIGRIVLESGHIEVDREYAASHLGVKTGSYAMLSVSDTGIGMSPEVKARIFEPFFTTKELGKGTGLGLSTVYGIVDQNQGTIIVYSEVGKGTTFKILLPVAEGAVRVPPADAGRLSIGGTETILLVEDEEALRNYMRLVLERNGYKVVPAGNGREALDLSSQQPAQVDLLLTDMVMPGMGGIDLADRISGLCPGIAILHMSGYTDRLWERGPAVNFIQKPFTTAALLNKVRNTLESKSKSN
jgi:PAS domain S-box-containing protein